jgi:hypothetical protein
MLRKYEKAGKMPNVLGQQQDWPTLDGGLWFFRVPQAAVSAAP